MFYTAQPTGKLGILDPKTGKTKEIPLGPRSAPHGVIVGPDGAAWVTDGGQNAIVRVDPATREVKVFALPADTGYANLNTLTFDKKGRVWFTGQSGYYGRLEPGTGVVTVWKSPRGSGPVRHHDDAAAAMSITRRWRATTSRRSTPRRETRPLSSHRPRTRARGACGPIRAAGSG